VNDDPLTDGRWRDPDGGTWRPHPNVLDPTHEDHHDYTAPHKRWRKPVPIHEGLDDVDPKPTLITIVIGGVVYVIVNVATLGAAGG